MTCKVISRIRPTVSRQDQKSIGTNDYDQLETLKQCVEETALMSMATYGIEGEEPTKFL